jgi:hypothetical protein
MGFLSPKPNPTEDATSRATTVVPSHNNSSTNLSTEMEKPPIPTSSPPTTSDSKDVSSINKETGLQTSTEATPGTALAAEEEMEKSLEKPEEEVEYPTGTKLAIITLSLCLSVFLVALDNTIIATAIPRITDQFRALDDGMIPYTLQSTLRMFYKRM